MLVNTMPFTHDWCKGFLAGWGMWVSVALTKTWLCWCFQEAYREEQLVSRLMRQSQQERRIAVQLMHVRHEKEVLWQNRIFREKQYEERRLKDFQDALDREAVNKTSLKSLSKVTFDPFYQVRVSKAAFCCQAFNALIFCVIFHGLYFWATALTMRVASAYCTLSLLSWFYTHLIFTASP